MSSLAGVRWGSATAAYQIEGAVDRDGRLPSIWDSFAAAPGHITRGDTGAVAARAYDDPDPILDAVEWLGLDTYRLSVAWCRVIAPDGEPNPAGIAYYRRILQRLRGRGISTVVTLYHWDLPQWLQERGGWTSFDTVHEFVRFVTTAATELGELVENWITINEPFCAAFHGHLSGQHAPGLRDEATALRVALVQLHAHAEAVRALRAAAPGSRVGLSMNLSDLLPASQSALDLAALEATDLVENRLFLQTVLTGELPGDAAAYFGAGPLAAACAGIDVAAIAEPLDFIGINYYEHNTVRAAQPGRDPVVRGIEKLPVPEPRSGHGVAVHPDGLTRVLARVSRLAPDLPIWVTENGIGLWDYLDPAGNCNDVERVAYIDLHIDAVAAALAQGVKVEAYYHWALTDTFEWSYGYQLRYGLFYLDYPSGRLVPKASALHYRARIAAEHERAARTLTMAASHAPSESGSVPRD